MLYFLKWYLKCNSKLMFLWWIKNWLKTVVFLIITENIFSNWALNVKWKKKKQTIGA